MFEREHHRHVALALQALDAGLLADHRCYFGGGTAMALRYGEYRESVDIDFLVSDKAGYRELRHRLAHHGDLSGITRPGMALECAREVRADQYGIRTQIRSGAVSIKFEIVLEARIELATPTEDDRVCGVLSLTPLDLAAEKLLANADRWSDDAVFSRDLIDLAMQEASPTQLRAACAKAEDAYDVRKPLAAAIAALRNRPHRLAQCMEAMAITTVSRARLWQNVLRLARTLAVEAA